MICINGNDVKISGSSDQIFEELVILKVVIAQDDNLRAMDQIAMEQAIEALKTKGYSIPEVRRYKTGGRDITDEFKKRMVYMKTTNDVLELPEAVTDTGAELAKMVGVTVGTLYSFISRGTRGYHKIEIEEDEVEHNSDKRDAHSDQKNRCRA